MPGVQAALQGAHSWCVSQIEAASFLPEFLTHVLLVVPESQIIMKITIARGFCPLCQTLCREVISALSHGMVTSVQAGSTPSLHQTREKRRLREVKLPGVLQLVSGQVWNQNPFSG